MRGWRTFLVAGAGAMSLVVAGTATASAEAGGRFVEVNSMTPVTGAAVGTVNDRGLTGGGIPWQIASGSGSVDKKTGHVHVDVTGLVLATTGTNPVTRFKAVVSCVTKEGIVNVSTATFPASNTGDATIDDTVSLPRCKDALVFVTNATGRWFAVSNVATEDEDSD